MEESSILENLHEDVEDHSLVFAWTNYTPVAIETKHYIPNVTITAVYSLVRSA